MNGGYGRPGMSNKGCTGMETAWEDLDPSKLSSMNAMNAGGNGSGCCGNGGWNGNYSSGGGSGSGWDPAIGCYPGNRNDGCNWSGPEGWGAGKFNTGYSQSMMMMNGMGEGGSNDSGSWGSCCNTNCFIGDGGNNGYSSNSGVGDEGYMKFGGAGGADPDSDPIDFDIDGLFSGAAAGDSADPSMMGFSRGMMADVGGMSVGGGRGGGGYDAAGTECGNPWIFQQQRGGQFPF